MRILQAFATVLSCLALGVTVGCPDPEESLAPDARASDATMTVVKNSTAQPMRPLPQTREEAIRWLVEAGGQITWRNREEEGVTRRVAYALDFCIPDYEGWMYDPARPAYHVDNEFVTATLLYLPELVHLTLPMTKVDDSGIGVIQRLPNLRFLTVTSGDPVRFPVALTDKGLSVIARHPKIETLFLQGLPITNDGLEKLAGATNLKVLFVANCAITGECFQAVRDIKQLEELHLARAVNSTTREDTRPDFSMPISTAARDAVGELNGRLQYLSLGGMEIHPSLLAAVGEIKSLRRLEFYYSVVPSERLAALIVALPELRFLGVHAASLDDNCLQVLSQSSIREIKMTPFITKTLKRRIRSLKGDIDFVD